MKRKFFMALIAVLVLCLTCGMLLVACNKDEGKDNGIPDRNVGHMVAFKELIQKLPNAIATSENGKKFGIDVNVSLGIDDETEANDDVTYNLSLLGNIDVTSPTANSEFYLAVTEVKGENTKNIFRLGYEKAYFYASVGEGSYYKIDAFSLAELVNDIIAATATGNEDATQSADDTLNMIINKVLESLFDKNTTASITNSGKTYTIPGIAPGSVFTVLGDAGALVGGTQGLLDILAGIIGMDLSGFGATLDGFIADLGLALPSGKGTVNNLFGLMTWIGETLENLSATLVVNFDDAGMLAGAALTVDYNDFEDENVGTYTLNASKTKITAEPVADVFANSGIDEDVKNQEAIGLLNFSVDGTITGYTGEDKSAKSTTYNIKIEADVNPFGLLKLIDSTSKETILEACHQLGYFRLTIDETTKGYEGNVITIFFDTSVEDAIYINVNLNDLNISLASLASKAQLGGKYSFEYLYDTIAGLLGGSAAAESSNDVTDIIGDIIAAISFDSNLTINLQSICDTLGALIAPLLEDVDLGDIEGLLGLVGGREGLVKGLLSALLNTSKGIAIAGGNTRPSDMYAPVIEIAINSASYGKADKSYGAADVADSHIVINEGDNTGYVKEITDGGILADGSFKVVKGFENNLSAIMPNGGVVVLTGTDMKGAAEQQFSGYVIGVDGVDGSIVGTAQDVTYNVIVGGNDLIALLSGFGMSPASLPLFGEPVKVEGKITLIDSTCENISKPEANGLVTQATPMVNTGIYGYMLAEGANSVTITVEGMTYTLDVTKPASVTKEGSDEDIKDTLKDGIITETGNYVVTYDFAGWKYVVNVTVVEKPDLALVNDTFTAGDYWGTMKSGKFSFDYTLNGAKKTHTVSSGEVKGLIVQVVDIDGLYGEKGSIVATNEIFGTGSGALMYKINSKAKPGKYEVYINTPDGILVDEITIASA